MGKKYFLIFARCRALWSNLAPRGLVALGILMFLQRDPQLTVFQVRRPDAFS